MREEINEKFRDARFNLYARKLSDLMRDGISDDPKTVNAFNLLVDLIVEGHRVASASVDNSGEHIEVTGKIFEGMDIQSQSIRQTIQAIEEISKTIMIYQNV